MDTKGYVSLGVALAAALGVHTLIFLSFTQSKLKQPFTEPLQLTLLSQAGGESSAMQHKPIQQQQTQKKKQSEPKKPRKEAPLAQSETVAKTKVKQDDIQTSQAKTVISTTDDHVQDEPKRDNSEQDNPEQNNHQQAATSTIPQHLQQQILAKIIYPRQAKRRGMEGTAKFALDIQQHSIQQATLLVSTGYQILDRAARKGIVSIQSLPLPDGTHLLPVTFRLH